MTNTWSVVVGGRASGKAAAIRLLAQELRDRGVRVAGAYQETITKGEDVEGYDVVDLHSGARARLASNSADPVLCNLAFDERTFEQTRRWTADARGDVIVLPVGKLEIGGSGHWRTITEALEGPSAAVVLTVRPHLLAQLVLSLPDPATWLELPSSPADVASFAQMIAGQVSTRAYT